MRAGMDDGLTADVSELVYPPAAILGDVDVARRVHGDPVRLVELAGEVSRTPEIADDLTGLAVDDLDLGVVLVDDEEESLIRRETDGHRRAAERSRGAL